MTPAAASEAVPEPGQAPGPLSPATAGPSSTVSPTTSLRAHLAEFLLVGGATLFLFPLAWLLRRAVGPVAAEDAVDFVGFHAAFLINNPHFAVTYLLFYRDARRRAFGDAFPTGQRERYLVSGFLVPAVLAAWAVRALQTGSPRTMGFFVQLMFLLVGWHYAKQGFGILIVLSGRRGFLWSALERNVALVHCFAAWAYAWASPFDPGREVQEKGVVFTTVAHPLWLEPVTLAVFLASAVAFLAVLARRWRADRQHPPLVPLVSFLITIWLWTVFTTLDRLMMYAIPALHSVQYLYFVWLLRRNEARASEGPPTFGKPAGVRLLALAVSAVGLAWLLFRGLPAFLDERLVPRPAPGQEPTGLGATPYLAAIYVFVNIHHYFMDHVLWRRENPETRYLRKDPRPSASDSPEPS